MAPICIGLIPVSMDEPTLLEYSTQHKQLIIGIIPCCLFYLRRVRTSCAERCHNRVIWPMQDECICINLKPVSSR